MSTIFSPSNRELYERASDILVQVVCELRFPKILRIAADPPASFQEAIMSKFPLYEQEQTVLSADGAPIPPEVLQLFAAQSGTNAHQFLTEDRHISVALFPERMAIKIDNNYTRWEDFRHLIEIATKALTSTYQVPFYSRIGLRYIDVVHRATLGLDPEHSWTKLINPDLLPRFPFTDFEGGVTGSTSKVALNLPEDAGAAVGMSHGLVNVQGKKGQGYLLDFDFSKRPKIETNNAIQILDHFHELAGRAFRWCLTDELRQLLGPRPLD